MSWPFPPRRIIGRHYSRFLAPQNKMFHNKHFCTNCIENDFHASFRSRPRTFIGKVWLCKKGKKNHFHCCCCICPSCRLLNVVVSRFLRARALSKHTAFSKQEQTNFIIWEIWRVKTFKTTIQSLNWARIRIKEVNKKLEIINKKLNYWMFFDLYTWFAALSHYFRFVCQPKVYINGAINCGF